MKNVCFDRRRAQLAKIHILAAQRYPGDDKAYRNMLWDEAGVKSAADLDDHGRRAVLDYLERGISARPSPRPSPEGRGSKRPIPRNHRPGMATYRQMRMIRGLWGDLKGIFWTEDFHKSLDGFIQRMAGVERLEWLPEEKVDAVMEALRAIRQRKDSE